MAFEPNRGPCYVFLGDPTTASGADMTYLGLTRGDVVLNPNLNIATGRADQTGMTPRADSAYDSGATPMVSVPFIDEEKAKMTQYLYNTTLVTNSTKNALGFGAGPAPIAVADILTLALIPQDQIAEGTNGIDAERAVWIPRALPRSIGEFTFNLPEGDDSYNPHTVEFEGMYYETDHDDQTIDAELRRGFIGTPNADTGLTWSLPALS